MNRLLSILLGLVSMTVPAAAQHVHPPGGTTREPIEKPMPVIPPPAGAACTQQTDLVQIIGAAGRLHLSTNQLIKLQLIETQLATTAQNTMQEAMSAYVRAAALLKGAVPDWVAFESELRAGAEKVIATRIAAARGDTEARNVLADEQLGIFEKLRAGRRASGVLALACMMP